MDTKSKVLQVTVLARVNVKDEAEAGVLGGNLARFLEANIPQNYEIVGVEYAGALEDEGRPTSEETTRGFNKARPDKDANKVNPTAT